MSEPTRASRRRPKAKLVLAGVIVTFGLTLAYAVGRFTAPGPSAPQAEPPPARLESPPLQLSPPPPRPAVVSAPAVAPAPPAPPPDPVAEVVAQATVQAKAELENLRPQMLSSCWPSGGLKGGENRATLTFNMTFDAQGHEIARGISAGRRARASAQFAQCLRVMEGTLMTIPPPGRTVAVSIPVTYP